MEINSGTQFMFVVVQALVRACGTKCRLHLEKKKTHRYNEWWKFLIIIFENIISISAPPIDSNELMDVGKDTRVKFNTLWNSINLRKKGSFPRNLISNNSRKISFHLACVLTVGNAKMIIDMRPESPCHPLQFSVCLCGPVKKQH